MKVFRVPKKHVSAARDHLGPLAHPFEDSCIISATAAEHLSKAAPSIKGLEDHLLEETRWNETAKRLHSMWAAVVSDPLPPEVAIEARLMLYVFPGLELEFMGRGEIPNDRHLPAAREFLVGLDRAGGKRTYLFRKLELPSRHPDERLARVRKALDWTKWVQDPGARVVVSLGGGGFRLFAATTVLKGIDLLAGGDRSRIKEVWGSSGGAFLGFLYASGFKLDTVEQFAFDLYNHRLPKLVDGSITSILRDRVRAAVKGAVGKPLPYAMEDWLAELEQREPDSKRALRIPYYAIASSTERSGLLALTSPKHFSSTCADFMIPCDPRLAVSASTAVPFVLRPVVGLTDRKDEQFYDGSISDENPLALPYVKWMRERLNDPAGTPERLKIVLVNLNLRSSESEVVRVMGKLPVFRKTRMVARSSAVVDRLLDSKTLTNIQIVTANPGVEVLSIKLNLGWLGVQDPAQIANAIRSGRTLESWQIVLNSGHATPT